MPDARAWHAFQQYGFTIKCVSNREYSLNRALMCLCCISAYHSLTVNMILLSHLYSMLEVYIKYSVMIQYLLFIDNICYKVASSELQDISWVPRIWLEVFQAMACLRWHQDPFSISIKIIFSSPSFTVTRYSCVNLIGGASRTSFVFYWSALLEKLVSI